MPKDLEYTRSLLRINDEGMLQREGEARALDVFHSATERVPAYKDFLHRRCVRASLVRSMHEFRQVPVTTQENYVSVYALANRCWNGVLPAAGVFSYSSGTSGASTVWPRSPADEDATALLHEMLLLDQFHIQKRKTLCVVAFAFGLHIAGVITLGALTRLLQWGHAFALATPGKNLTDAVDAIERLGPSFEQVILFGHPGFVKEIVTTLSARGHDWSRHATGCVVSGNGFFESWRAHILSMIGANAPEHIVGLYGCTDLGALAYETPLSMQHRRMAHPESFVFQYAPPLRFAESVGGELAYTVSSAAPAIRYSMHDRGDVIQFSDIPVECAAAIPAPRPWPFLVLHGRSQTIIMNGANIYTEQIQRALESASFFPLLTGRCVPSVRYTSAMDEEFVLDVELRDGQHAPDDAADTIRSAVISSLLEYNMEYADCVRALGEKVYPRVLLHPRGAAIFAADASAKKKL